MNKINFSIILIHTFFFSFNVYAEIKSYQCGENCVATLDENGIMRVSGKGKMNDYDRTTRMDTPWFQDRGQIKTLIIEDGITQVGKGSFYSCSNLQSIELSSTVETVGYEAFDALARNLNAATITMFDSTKWEYQDNLDLVQSINIKCRGNLKSCENNFMRNQTKISSTDVGLFRQDKRIYTLQEATQASGKKNKVMIRYK